MLQTEVDLQEVENVERQARKEATVRLLRYSALKLLALFFHRCHWRLSHRSDR